MFVYIPGEPERKAPQEVLDIKLHDLPSEPDKPEGVGEMHEQVYKRCFAVAKHQIELMYKVGELDEVQAYLR